MLTTIKRPMNRKIAKPRATVQTRTASIRRRTSSAPLVESFEAITRSNKYTMEQKKKLLLQLNKKIKETKTNDPIEGKKIYGISQELTQWVKDNFSEVLTASKSTEVSNKSLDEVAEKAWKLYRASKTKKTNK